MTRVLPVLAAIDWDVGIRGILVVAVGTLVLCGSTFLILATNSGVRLGFLLALTGLMGWMTIMGVVWMIYGIGYLGRTPAWVVKELNYGDLPAAETEVARSLPPPEDLPSAEEILAERPELAAEFPPGGRTPTLGDLAEADPAVEEELQLGEWELLSPANPQTGEAQATTTAFLVDEAKKFEDTSDFVVLSSYSRGGKEPRPEDANLWEQAWHKIKSAVQLRHPPHYAVVQVAPAIPQLERPGQPPPLPVRDESQPIWSVIMVRDLGSRRQPALAVTLVCGLIFAFCCNSLHRRDKLVGPGQAPLPATQEP
jgi:hypothetical protein